MRNTANVESDTVRRYILAEVVGAASRVSEAEAEAEVARKVRDDMIRRAKAQGVTLSELAALTGLSRARVQQVAPVEHDDETKVDLPEESATSAVSAG